MIAKLLYKCSSKVASAVGQSSFIVSHPLSQFLLFLFHSSSPNVFESSYKVLKTSYGRCPHKVQLGLLGPVFTNAPWPCSSATLLCFSVVPSLVKQWSASWSCTIGQEVIILPLTAFFSPPMFCPSAHPWSCLVEERSGRPRLSNIQSVKAWPWLFEEECLEGFLSQLLPSAFSLFPST